MSFAPGGLVVVVVVWVCVCVGGGGYYTISTIRVWSAEQRMVFRPWCHEQGIQFYSISDLIQTSCHTQGLKNENFFAFWKSAGIRSLTLTKDKSITCVWIYIYNYTNHMMFVNNCNLSYTGYGSYVFFVINRVTPTRSQRNTPIPRSERSTPPSQPGFRGPSLIWSWVSQKHE